MEKEYLDYSLVPLGLLVMIIYHLWLLHRIAKYPTKTVIGVSAISRRFWVQTMMEDVSRYGVLSVQSLRNTIMASTLLASTAIMLSSIIGMLITSDHHARSTGFFVLGDKSHLGFSIKLFSIEVCFLMAFLFNVQSVRYYSHASILINVPFKKLPAATITPEYVANVVIRGGYFWSLGLRAYYFSFPLFLWIFGPIPMVISCFLLVLMFYFLDVINSEGYLTAGLHHAPKSSEIHNLQSVQASQD